MLWVRHLLILLAVALVIANSQCVARCAVMPCHTEEGSQSNGSVNLPPCHRHHAPRQSDSPSPCALSLLPFGDLAPSAAVFAPEQSVVTILNPTPSVAFPGSLASYLIEIDQSASPPNAIDSVSRTVLRI